MWKYLFTALLCLPLVSVANSGLQLTETEFYSGKPYKTNHKTTKTLSIPGADSLEVHVEGSIKARQDILSVTAKNFGTKYFAGTVDEKFIVPGDKIVVVFETKGQMYPNLYIRVNIEPSTPLTEFKRIDDKIQDIIDSLASEGVNHAKVELKKSAITFETIKKAINNQAPSAQTLEEVIDGLRKIAMSYSTISALAPGIADNAQQKFQTLNKLLQDTQVMINDLYQRRADNQRKREETLANLNSVDSELEKRKLNIALNAQESLIASLSLQEKVWNQFFNLQEQLQQPLKAYMANIDLLLYTLGTNAKVYRETANAMQMQNDIQLAAQALRGLADLQNILTDIDVNWREVERIKQQMKAIYQPMPAVG
jgi:hypothetical protein